MLLSNVVMWFIVATTASTLFQHGIKNIDSAPKAAEALRPIAGEFAYLLFAVGIIGTGLLAVPILAGSAAYAVAETFKLREGLYLKLRQAPGFYSVIAFSTLLGFAVNLIGINPIQALYYTAVLNERLRIDWKAFTLREFRSLCSDAQRLPHKKNQP
jgi:Mn2+/Fe2+ NRAMP family transporter